MAVPRPRTAAASASLLLLAASSDLVPVADAGWIDPATPENARVTYGLPAVPPPPPPPWHGDYYYPGEPSDDWNAGATNATDAPTTSFAPTTASPTPAPTTASPTSSPTRSPVFRRYELVMSDEFNVPGRTFADGSDPMWTALHKNDYTNDAQHFYNNRNAYTDDDGHLVIETEARDTEIIGFDDVQRIKTHATKHFRSAMLQSWNKFCFTGGIIETEAIMPGNPDVGGLWPAFWLLGNLARHTYVGSSEHVWPWSSTVCTEKSRDAQLISGCSKALHWGMDPQVGRGSPEIDIFEVQPGNIRANTGKFLFTPVGQPFMSASYQIAPGIPLGRPGPGWWPGPGQWYDGLVGGDKAALNILFYGAYNHFSGEMDPMKQDYWSDAISFNRQLYKEHFEKPHRYRLEWEVPDPDGGNDGYLHWFLDDQLVLKINGTSIVDRGLGSSISSEPSYIILNTAISSQWGFPPDCPANCPCDSYNCHSTDWRDTCGFSPGFCDMIKKDSVKYKINYVRVYQDPNDPKQKVGCSTPERPTRRWIEAHEELYKQEGDAAPLKPVQRGEGACIPPGAEGGDGAGDENGENSTGTKKSASMKDICGGITRGRCTEGGVCECRTGWTGPNCLARQGKDDIVWDEPDTIADVGFHPPGYFPRALVVGFALCAMLFLGALVFTRRGRKKARSGYAPILNARKGAGWGGGGRDGRFA